MSVKRFKQGSEAEARRSIPNLLRDGRNMYAYHFNGYWKDVGTISSLWEANMEVLDPEVASLMKESVARAGHAAMAKIRHQGYDVPASEFELRRDENDLKTSVILDGKISNRLQKK